MEMMKNSMMGGGMMDQEKETSKAVEILSEMVHKIMCKIKDVDGVEKQQTMMLQFFQFLGKVKSLEDAAQKLLSVAIKEDDQEIQDEKQDDTEENLYF